MAVRAWMPIPPTHSLSCPLFAAIGRKRKSRRKKSKLAFALRCAYWRLCIISRDHCLDGRKQIYFQLICIAHSEGGQWTVDTGQWHPFFNNPIPLKRQQRGKFISKTVPFIRRICRSSFHTFAISVRFGKVKTKILKKTRNDAFLSYFWCEWIAFVDHRVCVAVCECCFHWDGVELRCTRLATWFQVNQPKSINAYEAIRKV